jgi:hypothetical protein
MMISQLRVHTSKRKSRYSHAESETRSQPQAAGATARRGSRYPHEPALSLRHP